MNIGLFFGSFNPIHNGHLIIAEYISNFFVDQVWFIPSPQNPLKNKSDLLSINDRIELVKIAIEGNSKFKLSAVELQMPIPSYTIDTIRILKKENPNHKFFMIIGYDNFITLEKWKNGNDLLNNYNIIVYKRYTKALLDSNHPPNIVIVNAPLIDISATEIRKLITDKKSVRYLVPDGVFKIISENQFYLSKQFKDRDSKEVKQLRTKNR